LLSFVGSLSSGNGRVLVLDFAIVKFLFLVSLKETLINQNKKNMSINLILYHTEGCHLCEQAEVMLGQISSAKSVTYAEIDIISDRGLLEQYADEIPVVENAETGQIIKWPFSILDLMEIIA